MENSTLIFIMFLRLYCESGRVGVSDLYDRIQSDCGYAGSTIKQYTIRQWYKSALLDGIVFRKGRYYYYSPENELQFLMEDATRKAGY